ncbi:unnamed protein product [Calicophoron daubneyi]|uniref:DNA mismatch repair proteins mutS family domain-containing protein n=1 Tax=Calicophoron daubneyi TaxID=300641 RepID=A0AAV2TCS0_CALDB
MRLLDAVAIPAIVQEIVAHLVTLSAPSVPSVASKPTGVSVPCIQEQDDQIAFSHSSPPPRSDSVTISDGWLPLRETLSAVSSFCSLQGLDDHSLSPDQMSPQDTRKKNPEASFRCYGTEDGKQLHDLHVGQPVQSNPLRSPMEDEFYRFWKSLECKPQSTLRCFERGEIYTLHDADALLVAKDYFRNNAVIRYDKGRANFPYVIVKKSNSDFLRHFILRRQYRIEIYSSSTKSGRDNDWVLKAKASPGNLGQIEDILLCDSDLIEASGLSSLTLKWSNDQLYVHLGFCHKEERRFVVGEFIDSVQLANVETALIQLETRECLVPAGLLSASSDADKLSCGKPLDTTVAEHLSLVFERAGILVTEVNRGDFTLPDVTQDLGYLLKRSGQETTSGYKTNGKELDAKGGLMCLGAIIKFLDLKADDANANAFSIDTFNLENFVRLDTAAVRALHLLPGPDDKNRYQSVYGVLNNCRTAQGQRLLAQWLRQPLTDVLKIDERLDLVESLVDETGIRQGLHDDFLRRVPDLQRLMRRLQKKRSAGLQEVYRIYQTIARLPHAVDLLRQYRGAHFAVVTEYLTKPLEEAFDNFAKFQEMVESTIDLNTVQHRNEFIIRSDFDEALGELRTKLDELEERIEEEFKRSARKLNLEPGKSIKLDSNDQLGFFMRITLKEEKVLREFKSFEILDTQKAGVRFRNSAMSSLNEDHMQAKSEYAAAQQSIVDEVIRIAAGYVDPLCELNATTALLDVIVSLAVAAVSAPSVQYVRPRILPRSAGRVIFRDARHPCLEMQESVSVIPNDVHLERGKQIFQVITGPNMGGKSTYIRGAGVIAAMAQIGSFVPCSSAELIPFDAIMARVGAADCQLRGVSTFLAEMLETSAVLRAATPNSLVIIDELGRGTSTFDGFGLAWAVASHLAGPDLGCFSLFATHFHELTSLAQQMPGRVANLRVTANVATSSDALDSSVTERSNSPSVTMLYKVEPGICNRSYGLDVARLAGLPAEVIHEAEIKANRDEMLESIWLKLDNQTESGDDGGSPKRSRMETGSDSLQVYHSHAVEVADTLRNELIRVLSESIDSAASDNGGSFGSDLAATVKASISNSHLPSKILLGLGTV